MQRVTEFCGSQTWTVTLHKHAWKRQWGVADGEEQAEGARGPRGKRVLVCGSEWLPRL